MCCCTLATCAPQHRLGSPRSLCIAFGGRIVRVGAPRTSQQCQQGNMWTQHMLLYARNMCTVASFGGRIVRFGAPKRLAALSSHRVRRSRSPRRRATTYSCSQQGASRSEVAKYALARRDLVKKLTRARNMHCCTLATCTPQHRPSSPRFLRIAFGSRIVRVCAPRPCQQGDM
jgi:hypothetical protein